MLLRSGVRDPCLRAERPGQTPRWRRRRRVRAPTHRRRSSREPTRPAGRQGPYPPLSARPSAGCRRRRAVLRPYGPLLREKPSHMHIRDFQPDDLPALIDLTIHAFRPLFEVDLPTLLDPAVFAHDHGTWAEDYRRDVPTFHDPGQPAHAARRSDGRRWVTAGLPGLAGERGRVRPPVWRRWNGCDNGASPWSTSVPAVIPSTRHAVDLIWCKPRPGRDRPRLSGAGSRVDADDIHTERERWACSPISTGTGSAPVSRPATSCDPPIGPPSLQPALRSLTASSASSRAQSPSTLSSNRAPGAWLPGDAFGSPGQAPTNR